MRVCAHVCVYIYSSPPKKNKKQKTELINSAKSQGTRSTCKDQYEFYISGMKNEIKKIIPFITAFKRINI